VQRAYRLGQVASASMVSLAHGTNDAQKTMGIITLALITNGNISAWSASTGQLPRQEARTRQREGAKATWLSALRLRTPNWSRV